MNISSLYIKRIPQKEEFKVYKCKHLYKDECQLLKIKCIYPHHEKENCNFSEN